MNTYYGVSGNSFTVVAPDLATAEAVYDAYHSQEACPVCEGELPDCGHFEDDDCADHIIHDETTESKDKTVNKVIQLIYEENQSHLDFMDNMGGDCDCNIHQLLIGLAGYIGVNVEDNN